jgi:oligoendopeptidase F
MLKALFVVLLLGIAVLSLAQSAPPDPDLARYVWDLSTLYPDEAAWQVDRDAVVAGIKSVGKYRGTLGGGPKALAEALNAISDLRTRSTKLTIYGLLTYHSNSSSERPKIYYDVATGLEPQVESAVAFAAPELAQLGGTTLRAWVDEEPGLGKHRIRIFRSIREATHVLPPDQEKILASVARWPLIAWDVFWALHEADLDWPKMKASNGQEVPVTLANYRIAFAGDERPKAMDAFLQHLRRMQDVFGLLYTRRIEADSTIAKHRKFEDGIDALWFLRDGAPEGAYKTIIAAVRDERHLARRYLELRSQALGLSSASYRTFSYPPPAERSFPIATAIDIVFKSSAPLGDGYLGLLHRVFDSKWIDLPPRPGKRDIVEMSMPVGGAAPYGQMIYSGTHRSSRVLSGMATDLVKMATIPAAQTPDTRDDPPVYGNGIYYLGQMMHDDYLLAHASEHRERIAYLVNALDFTQQFQRWGIMTELDARVQERIAEGKTPTGNQISEMYLSLLRQYYRNVEDVYAAEWMTYSVPFGSYEHQFWEGSLAFAAYLDEKLRDGHTGIVRKAITGLYRQLDTDRSYGMLKEVNFDLCSPMAYAAIHRRIERLSDELEKELTDSNP